MDAMFLRNQIEHEVFDYQMLLHCLRDYERPRDKITDLLRKGMIIRVKKGLYVFGEGYRRAPVYREILANLIYGPSYVSLEYALAYHRMIPERVEEVTSVTMGRSRRFTGPFGVFSYRHISPQFYQIGMDRVPLDDGRAFLIATPEKALADKCNAERGMRVRDVDDLRRYLTENLRVEPETLEGFDPDLTSEIAKRGRTRRLCLLAELVHQAQQDRKGRL